MERFDQESKSIEKKRAGFFNDTRYCKSLISKYYYTTANYMKNFY